MNREAFDRVLSKLNVNVSLIPDLADLDPNSLLNYVNAQVLCNFNSPRPNLYKEEYSIVITFNEHESDQARAVSSGNKGKRGWTYGSHIVPVALYNEIVHLLRELAYYHPDTFSFKTDGPTLTLTNDLYDDYFYFKVIIK